MERLLHWVHTVSFVPLVVTGLVLYLDFLKPLAQGEAGEWMRLVHRLTAILFIGEPVIYGILQPRRLWMHIKEFGFERDDIGWMKNAFGYYVLGRHTDHAPPGPVQHRREDERGGHDSDLDSVCGHRPGACGSAKGSCPPIFSG